MFLERTRASCRANASKIGGGAFPRHPVAMRLTAPSRIRQWSSSWEGVSSLCPNSPLYRLLCPSSATELHSGVRNPPRVVATTFHRLLNADAEFQNAFEQVIVAILSREGDTNIVPWEELWAETTARGR